MKRKVRAIFFDIDDTLYSTTEFAKSARLNSIRAMRALGLKISEGKLSGELNEVIAEFSSNYEHHFDKLLLRLPATAYMGINKACLISAAMVAYHQTKFRQLRPYSDVIPTLKTIASAKLIRGIISAGLEIKQAEKIIRLGIYKYLTPDAIFISDQIGISKPNVKLYERACADTGVKPGEAIYVGDNPLSDVDPPNAIGMITIRSRRSGKYKDTEGKTKPDYEIHRVSELINILRKDFGVNV